MTQLPSRRGRPRGTGKNDNPVLAQVADLLVNNLSLTPTTAMKRIIRTRTDWGASDATLLRRWQAKWQTNKDSLLAAASERARPKSQVTLPQLIEGIVAVADTIDAFQRQVEQVVGQPGFQRFLENIDAFQRQVEQVVSQPGFQRFLENIDAWQQKVERTSSLPR
jgi:hypothetical protein